MIVMACVFAIHMKAHAIELELMQAIRIASDSTIAALRAQNLFLSQYWEYRNYKAGRRPNLVLQMSPIQYNRDIVKRYVSESDMDVYKTQQSLYSYGKLSASQIFALTGGTFYIDSELSFFRHFGLTTSNQFSSVPIRIGYSQSLLGYNPFKWDKLISTAKYDYAKKELLYNLEDIAVSTISYYFNLVLSECNYKQAEKRAEISRRLFKEAQERFEVQMISSTELQAIELLLTESQNDSILCMNAKCNAELALQSFLNLSKDAPLTATVPSNVPVEFIPVDDALYYAKANYPSLWKQKQKILEAKQIVAKTSRERFMDADINISIGFNQVADKFSSVYHKPLQQNMAVVSMTIPLVDWGIRKGRSKIAQSNLQLAENTARQEELSVEEDVISLVNDFNAKVKVIHTSIYAIKLAENILDESVESFYVGKGDINQLNDNMMKIQTAMYGYISTLYECWSLYYRIRQMTLFDFEHNYSVDLAVSLDKLSK